jgi:hAT family C-terminal dimerisation region
MRHSCNSRYSDSFISSDDANFTGAGSAVAVERVFSGGRDAISLRRASLKPETIQKVMILKHKLLLARRTRLREEALAQSTFI